MLSTVLMLTAMLPGNWVLTPVLQNSETLGLRLNSWAVQASAAQIDAFKQSPTLRCTPLPGARNNDWHCLNEDHLYTLLQHGDGYLWVESEPIGMEQTSLPAGVKGEVISHYRNAFEEVTIVHASQHLFAAYSLFQRSQRQRGAVLVMQERDADTFIQQWQRGATKWTLTGQREGSGGVSLVHTRGTTQ